MVFGNVENYELECNNHNNHFCIDLHTAPGAGNCTFFQLARHMQSRICVKPVCEKEPSPSQILKPPLVPDISEKALK